MFCAHVSPEAIKVLIGCGVVLWPKQLHKHGGGGGGGGEESQQSTEGWHFSAFDSFYATHTQKRGVCVASLSTTASIWYTLLIIIKIE